LSAPVSSGWPAYFLLLMTRGSWPWICFAQKFEFIALPDMENYVDPTSNAHIMAAQRQWVADQRAAELIGTNVT